MSDGAHLTTWVNRETKTRFAAVARHQGLSDSALLKRLIDTMLQAGNAASGAQTDGRVRRASRFSIRLRPDARPPAVAIAAAQGGTAGAQADGVGARQHWAQPLPDRAGSES